MPKIVDHDQRRAEVLEATWRVIARLGIEGTTTREIAREADCSTGVLAHYFSNKDEILRLALDYAHVQVRSRITALRQRMDGAEVLRAVLVESLPLDSQRHVEMTLEISFWARAVAQTNLRASQHADFDRWHRLIRDLIVAAVAAGELAADLDPDDTAAVLVCFTDGLGTNSCLYPERLPAARVEALLDRQLALVGGAQSPAPVDRDPGPMIRVGLVGLGRISTLHLDAYLALGDAVAVAAVCDVDPARAAEAAGRTGAAVVSFEQLLDDPTIDAVEILVPSSAQAALAERAIAAGKHVTVQKPLAGDLVTGRRLVDLAESAGVRFRVFENTVNAPSWRRAEELIAAGAIGRPLSIYLRWANSLVDSGWDVPADAWEWRRRGAWAEQFAAPSLFDDSAHLLSPAVALFGDVGRAVALTGTQTVRGRATGFPYAISWHHRDGGQAVVEGTLCDELVVLTEQYSADTSITITGSAGLLWINTGEGRVAARPTVEVARDGRLEAFAADHRWASAWHVAQAEWIAALRDGSPFRWTGRDALRVLAGSLLVDDAIRTALAT